MTFHYKFMLSILTEHYLMYHWFFLKKTLNTDTYLNFSHFPKLLTLPFSEKTQKTKGMRILKFLLSASKYLILWLVFFFISSLRNNYPFCFYKASISAQVSLFTCINPFLAHPISPSTLVALFQSSNMFKLPITLKFVLNP